MNDVFTQVGKQLPTPGGRYLNPDYSYIVVVERVRMRRSRRLFVPFVVIDFGVLDTNDPGIRPGTSAAQVMNTRHPSTDANFTGFLAAAHGIPPDDEFRIHAEVDRDTALRAVDPDEQPHRGAILRVDTTLAITSGGDPITKHLWSPAFDATRYWNAADLYLRRMTLAPSALDFQPLDRGPARYAMLLRARRARRVAR